MSQHGLRRRASVNHVHLGKLFTTGRETLGHK